MKNNTSNTLLILMASLSQLKHANIIKELFVTGVNDTVNGIDIAWKAYSAESELSVSTSSNKYGSFDYNREFAGKFPEMFSLLQNLAQMLAVILENIDHENQLKDEKRSLEYQVAKQTELLSESEKKYKAFYIHAPVAYQSLNKNGVILDVNNSWLLTLGYEKKEVIGKLFADFVHPQQTQKFKASFTQFKNDGYIKNARLKLRCKNGEFISISLEGQIHKVNNEVDRTFCTFKDISSEVKSMEALKESETRFRSIYDNSAVGIAIIDSAGNFQKVNKKFSDIVGYSELELLSLNYIDITHPEDANYDYRTLEKNANNKVDSLSLEKRYIKQNGEIVWVELHSSIIRNSDNTINYIVATVADITERKNVLEELQKWAEVFHYAEWGVAITTNDCFSIERFNPTFLKIYGYSKEELLSKTFADLFIINKKEHVKNHLRIAFENGNHTIEAMHVRANGEKFPVLLNITSIKNSMHRVKYCILNVLDVTELKKAQEKIRESEHELSLILEATNDIVWDYDHSTGLVKVNDRFFQVIGSSKTKNHFELNELSYFVFSDDVEYITRMIEFTIQNQEFVPFQFRLRHSKGKFVWVYARGKVIKKGDNLRIIGTFVDITNTKLRENELKKAKERSEESERTLQKIFDNAPVLMFLLDNNLNIVRINIHPENSWMFGGNLMLGKNPGNVLHCIGTLNNPSGCGSGNMCKLCKIQETIRTTKEMGISYYKVECEVLTQADEGFETKTVLVSTSLVLKENKQHILVTIDDITERKKMEDDLSKAKELAEKSDRLKSDFLAQMSHEIRTPIGAIMSFSQLLHDLDYGGIPETKDIFEGIESSGKRIIRTVNMLLNVSEIQSGIYEYAPKNMNIIEDILEGLITEFKYHATLKGIELKLNYDEDISLYIDEYSVTQIFANLIDNAVKYTNEGYITLTIAKDDEYAEIEVRDTGIGISQEFLPDLFKPFSQEEHGYTRKFEGTGLGLTLVREYCELNNAKIKVESKKGEGTGIKVYFKLL